LPITKDDLYVVIASDGLWEKVPDEEVSEIVITTKDPQSAASKLKALTTERGSEDNISIVVVQLHNDQQ
jgi:serine/threonine protein phosphatase PrpC